MTKKQIYMTDKDMHRLKELVKKAREFNHEDEKYLIELESEIERACVVKSEQIPDNVITMNSQVLLKDMDNQQELSYWLVFPKDSDPSQDKISILTPIGTALLGYKVGDIIEWLIPAGTAKLKVEKIIYQPEAAGDFGL